MPSWDRPGTGESNERPMTAAEKIAAGQAERDAAHAELARRDAQELKDLFASRDKQPGDQSTGDQAAADAGGAATMKREDTTGETDSAAETDEQDDAGRLKDLTRLFRREPDDTQPPPPEADDQGEQRESQQDTDKTDEKSEADERELARELAEEIDQEINREVDRVVDHLNPKYDPTKSAYRENCTGVVQAYELQRRGQDVQPGALEKHLRQDEGGPGGRDLAVIENAWGGKFTPGTKTEIEAAFSEPGSRGVVYLRWKGPFSGGHVFNVENVGGDVRFIDGQPASAGTDVSHYFDRGTNTMYLRTDDLPTPHDSRVKRFLEP